MPDIYENDEKTEQGGAAGQNRESPGEPGKAEKAEDGCSRGGRKVKICARELEELKGKAEKSEECFDQLLRLKAEFDNYRKRINREREEFAAYAVEEIASDFLEVIDNLERAISSAGESGDFSALQKGVELTHKDSMKVLERWGVKEAASLGEDFDPKRHEAVEHVDSRENAGKIVGVMRKGYLIKDKILRPALVKVGKGVKNGKDDRD